MKTLTVDEMFEVAAGTSKDCANTILAYSGIGGLVGAVGGWLGAEVGFVAGGVYAIKESAACAG
ncbi:MAG: hypothetical protein WC617_05345 [Rhodanobacter sp.]